MLLDMIDPLLEPVVPILKIAGYVLDPLIDAVTPILKALLDAINKVTRLFPITPRAY